MGDMPEEFHLLLTKEEARCFIRFLDDGTAADELIEIIRLQLIRQVEGRHHEDD